MYHQGARVNSPAKVAKALRLPERTLDQITFEVKNEAHRLALSNRNKPWARRWLRDNGRMY